MVLKMEGVQVGYPDRTVLRGLDLTVDAGEIVALVGPNGAGKTTTLRTALGLLRPLDGRVQISGREPGRGRRHVGYVPQRHDVDWSFPLTVQELVVSGRFPLMGLAGRPARSDLSAVARALEMTGLSALAQRPLAELSGGQRQRTLLARALCLEPALLLLDEPATGVDVVTQQMLTALLRSVADDGTGVLLTTHDLASAVDLADRLVVVDQRVVIDAPPQVAVHDPALAAVFGERTALQLRALVQDGPTAVMTQTVQAVARAAS